MICLCHHCKPQSIPLSSCQSLSRHHSVWRFSRFVKLTVCPFCDGFPLQFRILLCWCYMTGVRAFRMLLLNDIRCMGSSFPVHVIRRGKVWHVMCSVKFGCFTVGDELPLNLTGSLWSKQTKTECWQGLIFDHKAPDIESNLAGTYLGS